MGSVKAAARSGAQSSQIPKFQNISGVGEVLSYADLGALENFGEKFVLAYAKTSSALFRREMDLTLIAEAKDMLNESTAAVGGEFTRRAAVFAIVLQMKWMRKLAKHIGFFQTSTMTNCLETSEIMGYLGLSNTTGVFELSHFGASGHLPEGHVEEEMSEALSNVYLERFRGEYNALKRALEKELQKERHMEGEAEKFMRWSEEAQSVRLRNRLLREMASDYFAGYETEEGDNDYVPREYTDLSELNFRDYRALQKSCLEQVGEAKGRAGELQDMLNDLVAAACLPMVVSAKGVVIPGGMSVITSAPWSPVLCCGRATWMQTYLRSDKEKDVYRRVLWNWMCNVSEAGMEELSSNKAALWMELSVRQMMTETSVNSQRRVLAASSAVVAGHYMDHIADTVRSLPTWQFQTIEFRNKLRVPASRELERSLADMTLLDTPQARKLRTVMQNSAPTVGTYTHFRLYSLGVGMNGGGMTIRNPEKDVSKEWSQAAHITRPVREHSMSCEVKSVGCKGSGHEGANMGVPSEATMEVGVPTVGTPAPQTTGNDVQPEGEALGHGGQTKPSGHWDMEKYVNEAKSTKKKTLKGTTKIPAMAGSPKKKPRMTSPPRPSEPVHSALGSTEADRKKMRAEVMKKIKELHPRVCDEVDDDDKGEFVMPIDAKGVRLNGDRGVYEVGNMARVQEDEPVMEITHAEDPYIWANSEKCEVMKDAHGCCIINDQGYHLFKRAEKGELVWLRIKTDTWTMTQEGPICKKAGKNLLN